MSLRSLVAIVAVGASSVLFGTAARADFAADCAKAADDIRPVVSEGDQLLVEGRLDEANAKLLKFFPDVQRTAAQAFTLGNLLFARDPKASYALHKRVAQEVPDDSNVRFEWAMQQHRAKEYAGAAATYRKYLDLRPSNALGYGLMAECLLRQGRIKEALDAWNESENALTGTLERFETLVWEVNRSVHPMRQRADLLTKVRAGDLEAAEKLIFLDCRYPYDWWNEIVHEPYLQADLKTIRGVTFADESRKNAILSAGEAMQAIEDKKKEEAAAVLRKAGYLLDPKATLPKSCRTASLMLRAALSSGALEKDAEKKWRDPILAMAKRDNDAEGFNVAAFLSTGKQLSEAQQLGWDLTGDQRCAVGRVISALMDKELKFDSPILAKALKQFPEDSV